MGVLLLEVTFSHHSLNVTFGWGHIKVLCKPHWGKKKLHILKFWEGIIMTRWSLITFAVNFLIWNWGIPRNPKIQQWLRTSHKLVQPKNKSKSSSSWGDTKIPQCIASKVTPLLGPVLNSSFPSCVKNKALRIQWPETAAECVSAWCAPLCLCCH